MKFDELRLEQLKEELSKLDLPTARNKVELQKRLMEEFKRRGIDIGSYEFDHKEEVEISTSARASVIDANSMLAAIMAQFAISKRS